MTTLVSRTAATGAAGARASAARTRMYAPKVASPADGRRQADRARGLQPAVARSVSSEEAERRGDHRQLLVHDRRRVLDSPRVDQRVGGDAAADRECEAEIAAVARPPTPRTRSTPAATTSTPANLCDGCRLAEHATRDRTITGAEPRAIG